MQMTQLKNLLLAQILFLTYGVSAQTKFPGSTSFDENLLNQHILKEVNGHRKKVKADALYIDDLLKPAADDHSAYMAEHDILTHFQKSKAKKTPKNRVDFYGEQFANVGENCQQTYLKMQGKHDVKTYEDLAEVLVTGWRNSPPHYANMINEDYTTTYTSVHIGSDGKIYACQLFGSDAYTNSYRDSVLTYRYKPSNERRCRNCEKRVLVGSLEVVDDSLIVYSGVSGLFRPKYVKRRLRLNRWRYGLAADIVLKEQYDCDTNIVFNGQTGVRGIPLDPVMKKDFRKGANTFFWKFIYIELGVVPEWIDQDYEVNLTLINSKRTCMPIIYNVLPTEFEVDFKMDLYLDSLTRFYKVKKPDTLIYRINFDKSVSGVEDSLLNPISDFVVNHLEDIKTIEVRGFASIEGKTESNIQLYKSRANVITERLIELGIDSSVISVSSAENYVDFRRDIKGTAYEYLLPKPDSELKAEINKGVLSKEFEYLLKNHRFAEIHVYAETYEERVYTKEMMYYEYSQNLSNGNIRGCKNMQGIEYNMALNNEISVDEIKAFKIPYTKQNIDLIHDRNLMIYRLDTLNPIARQNFRDTLIAMQELDPKDQRINTSLAILEYEDNQTYGLRKMTKYFNHLKSLPNLDKTIQARMLLNFAARHDWYRYFGLRTRVSNTKKHLYDDVKFYIKDARLDLNETFDLATYYAFFEDYHFAFELTKKIVFRSQNPEEIVFFLKLTYYLDESLSSKTVVKYFDRIAKLKGDEFCTYFNSPYLNFQILDDPEIREIYCRECND